jgi:hypothetical protein
MGAVYWTSRATILRKRYQAALREVLEATGAVDPDADYRRLADMEYRDDEMALFESVLVSDGSLGRFSRAQFKEPIGSSSSGSTSTSTTR